MDVVLSHMTALSALRHPRLAHALGDAPRVAGPPPLRAPNRNEMRDLVDRLPWLRSSVAPLEVLTSSAGERRTSALVRSHVFSGTLPPGSLVKLAPGVLCAGPALLSVQLAPLLSRLELIVLLSELMGTYAVAPDLPDGMLSRRRPLETPERMATILDALGPTPGARRARWAARLACKGSASPRETKLSLRLGLKPALGGWSLPVLSMNEPLEVRRIRDAMRAGIRKPDILLMAPDGHAGPARASRGLAVEYLGRHHDAPAQAHEDALRHNELEAMGLKEYAVRREEYADLDYMNGLVDVMRADLGLPRQRLSEAERQRRHSLQRALYQELELIDGIRWNGLERERAREAVSRRSGAPDDGGWDVVPPDAYGL